MFKKWIKKKGSRAYAHLDKDEAKYSYMRRKRAQVKILERQLNRAKSALAKGIDLYKEDKDPLEYISNHEEYIKAEEMNV